MRADSTRPQASAGRAISTPAPGLAFHGRRPDRDTGVASVTAGSQAPWKPPTRKACNGTVAPPARAAAVVAGPGARYRYAWMAPTHSAASCSPSRTKCGTAVPR